MKKILAFTICSLALAVQAAPVVAPLDIAPPVADQLAITPLAIQAPIVPIQLPYADCSPLLATMMTKHTRFGDLCTLSHRYHVALAALEKEGVKPANRMADLLGPRFADLPKWVAGDIKAKFDPVHFYQPAPITWVTFERGLSMVNKAAAQNAADGTIAPLTLDWLKAVHVVTMTGVMDPGEVPGQLRTGQEIGRILMRVDAVTAAQAQEMAKGSGYVSLLNPGQPLITWIPKVCFQDLDPATRQTVKAQNPSLRSWPAVAANQYFTAADGQQRQCGVALYTQLSEVPQQLDAWFSYVNSHTTQIVNGQMSDDAMEFFARVQRWFIAIHPFADGNGRMSRYMLETITSSLGLPPPIFAEMNNDILTPEPQWADQVAEGMWRTVRIAEVCAATPSKGGCNMVPIPAGVLTP